MFMCAVYAFVCLYVLCVYVMSCCMRDYCVCLSCELCFVWRMKGCVVCYGE